LGSSLQCSCELALLIGTLTALAAGKNDEAREAVALMLGQGDDLVVMCRR